MTDMKVQSDSIDTQALIGASQIGSGAIGPALADGQSPGAAAGLEALAVAPSGRSQSAALDPGEALLLQDVWQGESRSLAGLAVGSAGLAASAHGPDALVAYVLEPLA